MYEEYSENLLKIKAIETIENYKEWYHFSETEERAFLMALDALKESVRSESEDEK